MYVYAHYNHNGHNDNHAHNHSRHNENFSFFMSVWKIHEIKWECQVCVSVCVWVWVCGASDSSMTDSGASLARSHGSFREERRYGGLGGGRERGEEEEEEDSWSRSGSSPSTGRRLKFRWESSKCGNAGARFQHRFSLASLNASFSMIELV